jgi:RNA polymerase sigma factor (sigma-70 family)
MNKDRYIWIKGKHVPVTQEVYDAYYRPLWRERKLLAAHGNRDVSYETLMEKAKNKYAETTVSAAEDVFFSELLTHDLHRAISMLTDDERQIMIGIYVNDKTERELAVQLGVPNTTIHYRKAAALKKLKKLFTE